MARPDLFIVGAAKAGTTSVYEYLKAHPAIYMSPSKEPRYFAPDLDFGQAHDLHYGVELDRYLSLFAGATSEKRVGEASVRYLYSTQAPRLIHDFQPNAYIVAIVRNPVDVIYSLHGQRVSQGTEDITDFELALQAEEDRRAGRRLPPNVHPKLTLYRDVARFGDQLSRWVETFGRERVHVAVLDDLVADPARTLRSLLEFLEVDPAWTPSSFGKHNTGWAPRSRMIQRMARGRIPQWVVWRLLPNIVGDARTRRLVRRYQHSGFYRRTTDRPPLKEELRRQLENDFAADVKALGQLLGRDLAAQWWQRT